VVLVQSAPSGHHPRPLHTPTTAYTSVATLVSSGTAVDFRVEYASAIESLTDDIRSRVYADRADLVTWPMPK
jgi:hypothetical protein